ncbi:AAA family ATPase [Rossellomorea vietnamensis]|uniref:DNA 3'-5' helicase n=2 Tax=Rossellomorea TaxID=2837508 RepID=A0A5D4KFW1_9BACI|nr:MULTISPECIES: UvrD-helicase domain-containing protein [Rossellomorea]TYR75759.1 AAA family ATPase [Rossellomorea vietnamensis]TYS80966.1 AAA family ATPase [Rossellomorea aquimaris]
MDYFSNRPFGSSDEVTPNADIYHNQYRQPESKEDAFYFRMIEQDGIRLNESQMKAVKHLEGPCLTLAGAGSGKTSVLVARTGYLLQVQRVSPDKILLLTFSKKASMEMKTRVSALPGINSLEVNRIQAGTFHSFFLFLLRSRGVNQEILGNERFKHIILKQIQRKLGIQEPYQPETLLSTLSSLKIRMLPAEKLPDKTAGEKEIKKILSNFEEWKESNHKMDFDDILVKAYELLHEDSVLLEALQKRFQYIMVDEFQDTNWLQYELIKMIAGRSQNLFVVGDDDQTIYSFNGADHSFILDFDKEYPGAAVVTLDVNYRSNRYIVGLGNEVISRNQFRREKALQAVKEEEVKPKYSRPSNSDEEAEWTISQIKRMIEEGNSSYKDIAILHRTISSSRAIFERLVIEEVPFFSYNLGDQHFYDQWIVKPLIDHLRLSLVPRNFTAIEGILSTLYINRDAGMKKIGIEEETARKKYPLIHLIKMDHLKAFQKDKVKERIKLIKELSTEPPASAIKRMRKEFYDTFMDTNERLSVTEHKEAIKETLSELEASAARFPSISAFISFIDSMTEKHKRMQEEGKNMNSDAVSLMTIHRAKGLEFPAVFVIGASEGNLPHSSALNADKLEDKIQQNGKKKDLLALEEERRLMYVAITRAKNELFISSPAYYQGEKREISRFLTDVFSEKQTGKEMDKQKRERPMIKVSAWICSNDNCITWSRIKTEAEQSIKRKVCPLCETRMIKGEKRVSG